MKLNKENQFQKTNHGEKKTIKRIRIKFDIKIKWWALRLKKIIIKKDLKKRNSNEKNKYKNWYKN